MLRFLSASGWFIISLIGKTLRLRTVNAPSRDKGPLVYAFLHGEQFIPFYGHRKQGIAIMSSLSKDGEIQAGILSRFGYRPVRGSSSRGGERALVETIRFVKKGAGAAFAVDGPRGPRGEVKPGIVYLAQKTGSPLIPVSSAAKSRWILAKAWDRYELPLPFTRAVLAYGKPIRVGPDDDVEAKRLELETALAKLSDFTHGAAWSTDLVPYLDRHPRPKILIVQPSRIGDVIFSLPALSALRARYPHAWIGWFVDERCAPLLEGNPELDEVIVFDRTKRSLTYFRALARALRARKIDLSIDLHGLFKSAFMVALAGARYRIASSSTNGMRELSWLFSKEIPGEHEGMHCVERHLAVARKLGCITGDPVYRVTVSAGDEQRLDAILRSAGVDGTRPVVAIHPGGGWISRRWFPERFAVLAGRLVKELGAQVVLVGGKEGGAHERGLNEEIREGAGVPLIDLTGALKLKELAALLKRSTVFVANEAGPLHLATALGVPAVALLGPTDPRRTGPYGGKTRIIRHPVECGPCRERSCPRRICMERITVDEVFAVVSETMANRGNAA